MPNHPRKPSRSSLKTAAKKKPHKPNESSRKVARKRAPKALVKGVVDADVIDALLPNESRRFVGKKGRSGRKPNKLREYLAFQGELQVPRLIKGIEKIKHPMKRQLARQRFVDNCFKYGIGTTITQTRSDGSDINPPGTLSPNEMVLGVMKLLGKTPDESGA